MKFQFQKSFVVVVATVFSLAANQASAVTVIKAKKWALEDYTSQTQPRGLCIAWTYMSKGSTIYRLEFHRMKNETGPTEVQFRQTGAGENTAAWQIAIGDSGQSLSLGLRSQDATSKFFWPVPKTELLVSTLLAGGDVNVYSKGGKKEVKFELDGEGFAQVWASMQSHCSGSQQISNADYEREFLSTTQTTVDPLRLTPEIIASLKGAYTEGYGIYLNKLAKLEEMKALRAQYAPQLNEYESLTALENQLIHRDLPGLRAEQTANETLKSNSEKELEKVIAEIPSMQTAVNSSRAVLERAQEVIAPHLDEHKNLSDSVRAARTALSSAQGRLTSINSSIARLQSELRDLEYELQRVDREVYDARSRMNWAQNDYMQADREYRNFNPSQEERSRLQNNFQYQNAKNNLQSAQSQLGMAQNNQRNAQMQLNQAQQSLRQCQATAGAECSSQQMAVNSASQELQRANSQVQQLNSQIQQANRTISSIESDVRSEVRRLQNRLADRVQQARYEIDRLNSIINRGEMRIRDIRQYEIPNNQAQTERLQREAMATESEIASAQSRLRQSERELEAFEVRVGWDAKKSSLDSAQSDFDAKTRILATAQRRKTTLEQTIATCLSERTRLAAAIAEKTELLNRTQARTAELRNELAPYETARAGISADIQAIQASLNLVSSRFDATLPR